MPPLDAYRMVTLNPASYYGKDADLGGIAPGRCADRPAAPGPGRAGPAAVVARAGRWRARRPPARPRGGARPGDGSSPRERRGSTAPSRSTPDELDVGPRPGSHHPARQRGHHDARGARRSDRAISHAALSTAGDRGSPPRGRPDSPPEVDGLAARCPPTTRSSPWAGGTDVDGAGGEPTVDATGGVSCSSADG